MENLLAKKIVLEYPRIAMECRFDFRRAVEMFPGLSRRLLPHNTA
jgi:hypothetical protein